MLLFVSRSGASTPRNRREAASRCRCTAERSTRQGWRQGSRWFQICICAKHIPFSQSENQNQKGLHRPGIEPGSVPWQGTILPLDHRCIGFIASSAINFSSHDTGLAIFGLITRPKMFRPAKNVKAFHSEESVSTKVLHSHHYHARTAAKTPLRTASRLELRLELRLTPRLTPRTLNPKPNNPPCLE